jgi:protein-L-isoaspartate(D-aspartate) O-methyltransferase
MMVMNFDQARHNMVVSQVRTWEVLDERVLDAMARLPREDFVPAQYRNLAFIDTEIPIGHGQVMSAPKVVGRLLQALDIHPQDKVLEVGTGTGYTTALLATLARDGHVFSVDLHAELTAAAAQRLKSHGFRNVTLETGNAVNGWDQYEPYDVIAITGSLPTLAPGFQNFRDSLNVGGRLVVVVGEAPIMEATLIVRVGENEWHTDKLFETVLPPLQHATRPQKFAL